MGDAAGSGSGEESGGGGSLRASRSSEGIRILGRSRRNESADAEGFEVTCAFENPLGCRLPARAEDAGGTGTWSVVADDAGFEAAAAALYDDVAAASAAAAAATLDEAADDVVGRRPNEDAGVLAWWLSNAAANASDDVYRPAWLLIDECARRSCGGGDEASGACGGGERIGVPTAAAFIAAFPSDER